MPVKPRPPAQVLGPGLGAPTPSTGPVIMRVIYQGPQLKFSALARVRRQLRAIEEYPGRQLTFTRSSPVYIGLH